MTGHNSRVNCCDYHEEVEMILSASDDGSARLWDTCPGQPVGKLLGHSKHINATDFARPTGDVVTHRATGVALKPVTTVLSSSADGSLRLWDSALEPPKPNHRGRVTVAAISSDGRWAATGSEEGEVCIWNTDSASRTSTRIRFRPDDPTQRDATTALVFLPRNKQHAYVVLSGHASGQLSRYSITRDTDEAIISDSGLHHITGLAVIDKGKTVVISSWHRDLSKCDASLTTGAPVTFGPASGGHTDWVLALASDDTSNILVSSSCDNSVIIWDSANQTILHKLEHLSPSWVYQLGLVTGDEALLVAAACYDGACLIYSITDGWKRFLVKPNPKFADMPTGSHNHHALMHVAIPSRHRVVTGRVDGVITDYRPSMDPAVWARDPNRVPVARRDRCFTQSATTALASSGPYIVAGDAAGTFWDDLHYVM